MSIIADVHVGEPHDDWYHALDERVRIHFHNFANLPQEKGMVLKSSKFTCCGHEWYLNLYPRGDSGAREGMISVFLCTKLTSKIVVDFDIILKKKTGDHFKVSSGSGTKTEFPKPGGWGRKNYASRDRILDASNNVMNNGTLTFEVRIKPNEDYCSRIATPQTSMADDVYNNLYQDEDSADVAFSVDTRVFHAHKAILKARVPELADLAEPYDTENPIPIKDVDPQIFEEHAKQVLDAAGKYGFANLKSKAEAWHVKNLNKNFAVDNVVDELLYADGKNCPLLKKAAMDFILEHGEEVIKSESYEKLDEAPKLRKEVMMAFASNNKRKRQYAENSCNPLICTYKNICVCTQLPSFRATFQSHERHNLWHISFQKTSNFCGSAPVEVVHSPLRTIPFTTACCSLYIYEIHIFHLVRNFLCFIPGLPELHFSVVCNLLSSYSTTTLTTRVCDCDCQLLAGQQSTVDGARRPPRRTIA
eukprot:scaffold15241_cov65-Cyclotella_meneghiniana.AAC.1